MSQLKHWDLRGRDLEYQPVLVDKSLSLLLPQLPGGWRKQSVSAVIWANSSQTNTAFIRPPLTCTVTAGILNHWGKMWNMSEEGYVAIETHQLSGWQFESGFQMQMLMETMISSMQVQSFHIWLYYNDSTCSWFRGDYDLTSEKRRWKPISAHHDTDSKEYVTEYTWRAKYGNWAAWERVNKSQALWRFPPRAELPGKPVTDCIPRISSDSSSLVKWASSK